jgi:hypothetical protein
MSLNEDRTPCDEPFDKGQRVTWLMWDAGLLMPQHQTAILVLIDAVRAMPRLEATPEQEARFGNKLERWRRLDFCEDIWHRLWESTYWSFVSRWRPQLILTVQERKNSDMPASSPTVSHATIFDYVRGRLVT